MSEEVKRMVNWREVDQLVWNLVRKIPKKEIQNIYGVPRGGLIPAVMLSHQLNLPLLLDRSRIGKNTLIVDDLTDSGKTLVELTKEVGKVRTAVLFHNKESIYLPTYYGDMKPDSWIVFPYETNESSRYDGTLNKPSFNAKIT